MASRILHELKRRGVIQTLTAYVVSSWVIVEVADIAFPLFALPAWSNSLVGVMLLVGFPVAAYLSWFFNYSDGSVHRASDSSGGAAQPLKIRHWAGLSIITVAAGSAGLYLYEDVSDRLRKDEEGLIAASLDETVAVVPFEDLSPAHDQGFLAEGIAGEIASLLGRLDGVTTAATSASFRLARNGVASLDIGRQLSTATVLTGTVTVSGNRLRLRAELLRTDDGSVLWSDTFTRTINDVFTVQEEVARSIANILFSRYVEVEDVPIQARTASSDAYVFYLKGRAELRNRTTESVKAARKLFEQSVALDPEFAPAHIGIADTMWQLAKGVENLGNLDAEVAATVARKSIERALLIDDQLPEAYASLGRVEALVQKFEDSLTHYDKAISLNSSLFDVHVWRYLSLTNLSRYSDAMGALQTAAKLDPTAPSILFNLGLEFSERGDFDAAREQFDQLIELEPTNPMGYRGLAAAAFREGRLALSLEQWAVVRELSPDAEQYEDSYRNMLFSLGMLTEYRPLAVEAGDEVNLFLLERDFDAVEERMLFAVAANPDDPWVKFEAGWNSYLAGDFESGDAYMLEANESFSDEDLFSLPMCSPGIEVAFALRRSGRLKEFEDYLTRCEQLLRKARDNVFEDSFLDHLAARVSALRGDTDAAVGRMRAAYDHGWREWWTELDPLLQPVKRNTEMQRIFVMIQSDLERQRAIARTSMLDLEPPQVE